MLKVAQQPSIAAGHTKGYSYTGASQSVEFTKRKSIQGRHHWQLLSKLQIGQAKANPDMPWDPVLSGQHKASITISITSNGKNHVSGLQVYF